MPDAPATAQQTSDNRPPASEAEVKPNASQTTPEKPKKPKPARDPWDTPAMRQYRRFKDEHPGCVLFFRMGDFYEMFGDDADTAGRAMGLTIAHRGSPIPMAGVPHRQLPVYLKRAIDLGFRVAVVDQLEDPAQAKGVVERGVTSVVTAGTLIDDDLVPGETPSRLAAIATPGEGLPVGVCVVELSTGEVEVFEASPGALRDELARRGVREVLLSEQHARGFAPLEHAEIALTPLPAFRYRPREALGAIREHYRVASPEGFGIADDSPCALALGAALQHLAQTQGVGREPTDAGSGSEFQRQASTLDHLRAPRLVTPEAACRIDGTTLRSLEIERATRPGADPLEGSLLGVFLRSTGGPKSVVRTAMGKRLLRDWLVAPLADAQSVRARHDAVGAFAGGRALADAVGGLLSGVQDVARIAGRVALGRITPRDLVALGVSLGRARGLAEATGQCEPLRSVHAAMNELAGEVAPLAGEIARVCVDDPPGLLRDGGLVRDGIDAELDEARSLQADAGAWLSAEQARLIETHDLPSLKVGFNKVFGYYIELPRGQAQRAPDGFVRKQTLKHAERYITPELKDFEERVTSAESRALARERALFDGLCAQARALLGPITRYAQTVGELDVLLGFADKAHARGWVRPEVLDEPVLEVDAGRHPVLDERLAPAATAKGDGRFVPNDLALGTAEHPQRLALLTGPNMGGKSTYIRQNALIAILAMAGSFVPAHAARVGVCDRVFARVGGDDALHRGQSTFMVEMTETAAILNACTPRSLIVLDEIGRGTSTLDGLSLAWAIAEALAGGEAPPRTLFATHYHEITDLAQRWDQRVRNLHVSVDEWQTADGRTELAFLHRVLPGRADRSYGVQVARLAGVPEGVTERATELLGILSVQHGVGPPGEQSNAELPAATPAPGDSTPPPGGQLGLFTTEYLEHPVVDRLRGIDLETLSPMRAFDLLRELRSAAGGSG
ncbi:MAG: DNA mismatch repair protein MutS [Planctomycetota bacterium]